MLCAVAAAPTGSRPSRAYRRVETPASMRESAISPSRSLAECACQVSSGISALSVLRTPRPLHLHLAAAERQRGSLGAVAVGHALAIVTPPRTAERPPPPRAAPRGRPARPRCSWRAALRGWRGRSPRWAGEAARAARAPRAPRRAGDPSIPSSRRSSSVCLGGHPPCQAGRFRGGPPPQFLRRAGQRRGGRPGRYRAGGADCSVGQDLSPPARDPPACTRESKPGSSKRFIAVPPGPAGEASVPAPGPIAARPRPAGAACRAAAGPARCGAPAPPRPRRSSAPRRSRRGARPRRRRR